MNQDGNRLLIGVATLAVAIAAVALYARAGSASATGSSASVSDGRIALAGYRPEANASAQAALQKRVRDYQSEVTAALARGNPNPTATPANDEADEADLFDTDPSDDVAPSPANTPPPAEIPNPTDYAAQGNPNPVAYTTEGPVADNSPAPATSAPQAPPVANANVGDDYGQAGTMSDTDVYRLVVNNLSDDQRQDFTRAYAAMTVEQRADLLDGFRQQIQGGN